MKNGNTNTAAVPIPVTPKINRLANVVRGKLAKPVRVVLYATDGVGKSTFASHAPSPIFIGAEDGTAQLDVERMPEITKWSDIIDAVAELETGDHAYKSVVLDTADWAEPMNWKHICQIRHWADLDEPGYGKGPAAALEEWRVLLARFERLRNIRGMHIIVLAHCLIKQWKNPEQGGDYDRYEMALNPKASGLIRQWADCVLFGNYETFTHTDKNKRVRGISTGARIIHTQRAAAFDAKNRYDLPETLPLDWDAFVEAVSAHQPVDLSTLRKRIDEMLAQCEPDLRPKVEADIAKSPEDAAHLARIADRLTAKINIKSQESAS